MNQKKKQIVKNGVLIIYESVKSIDKFNKVLKDYSDKHVEQKKEFENYKTEIKEFKKQIGFDKEIKTIRNKIAGHIDTDFIEYSKIIDSINVEKTMNYLIAYRFIINRLNDYLFECIIK